MDEQQFNQPSAESIGESAAPQESPAALHEIIAQYGVPEELVQQVRDGTMLKADATRKTQEVAETRRSLEMQQAQLNTLMQWALSQQQQVQPQQTLSERERTWQQLTKGEEAPQLEPIKQMFDAQERDFRQQVSQHVAPLQQQLAEYKANEQYAEIYKGTVAPNFGKHLDDLWPQAVEVSKQFLRRGQVVDPLTVIAQYEPAKFREAALKHAQPTQTGGMPSEGMVMTRTQQPVVGNGAPQGGDPTSTANILREVQAMMRKGVSA